jgi:ABC-type branched-subunit amino acid transport system substrate-binding protein
VKITILVKGKILMPTCPPCRLVRCVRLIALLALSLSWLAACSTSTAPQKTTLTIATLFPETGMDATIGQAMQNAVDLAVQQNASLGNNDILATAPIDTAAGDPVAALTSLAGNSHLIGIVGPFDSQTAVAVLPLIEQDGIATISPGATLPGLTDSAQAAKEGLTFSRLHPAGTTPALFRIPEDDNALGRAAADLAVAPATSHGFAAQSVFIVDDGSLSGKVQAAAFAAEIAAQGGTVASQQTITTGPQSNAQAVVTAIIEAYPDLVFYAGDIAGGAELRSTLSLTGAPHLTIFAAGPLADDPLWGQDVGVVPAAAYTSALLPAQDLSALTSTKSFASAYRSANPGAYLLPQSALAYDAAMDEIAAIKGLIAGKQPLTQAAVLAAVASTPYAGSTGTLAFSPSGDDKTAIGFSLYSCDTSGTWHFLASLKG